MKKVSFQELDKVQKEQIEESPPELLVSVGRLLGKYGIESQLCPELFYRTDRTDAVRWNLRISGNDIRTLYEFCGDYLISTHNGLKGYIERKQEWHVDKGKRWQYYLENLRGLYREEGPPTSRRLAERCERAEQTVRNTMAILEKKGLVECVGHENRYKCWKPLERC